MRYRGGGGLGEGIRKALQGYKGKTSAPTPKMLILEYRVCDDLWVVSRPVFHEDSKSGLRFVSRLVEDYEFFIQTLGDPSRQKKYSAFYAITY